MCADGDGLPPRTLRGFLLTGVLFSPLEFVAYPEELPCTGAPVSCSAELSRASSSETACGLYTTSCDILQACQGVVTCIHNSLVCLLVTVYTEIVADKRIMNCGYLFPVVLSGHL